MTAGFETCSLCGERLINRHGVCSNCWKEWTITGAFPLPDWLQAFSREHRTYERSKSHMETPFAEMPETMVEPVYVEVRYAIIEEKYHKSKKRGRPREKW